MNNHGQPMRPTDLAMSRIGQHQNTHLDLDANLARNSTWWPWATVNVLFPCWPWAIVNVLPIGESDSDPEEKGEGDLSPCANEGTLLSLDTSDSYFRCGGVGHSSALCCDPDALGSLSSLCARDPLAPPTAGDDSPDRGRSRDGCRKAGRGSPRSPSPAAGVEVARGG